MDRKSKEPIATVDPEPTVFVRASLQELMPGDFDIVAGGAKAEWVPNG